MSSSGSRVSLQKLSSEKKARRVKFYRNGDKYFRGVIYVLQQDRTRTFDNLLDDLNNILIDQVSLPKGVRFIFAIDGERITSLDRLAAGHSYIGSSSDHYVKLDYEAISGLICFETGSSNGLPAFPAPAVIVSPAATGSGGSGSSSYNRISSSASMSGGAAVTLPNGGTCGNGNVSRNSGSAGGSHCDGNYPASTNTPVDLLDRVSSPASSTASKGDKMIGHSVMPSKAGQSLTPSSKGTAAGGINGKRCIKVLINETRGGSPSSSPSVHPPQSAGTRTLAPASTSVPSSNRVMSGNTCNGHKGTSAVSQTRRAAPKGRENLLQNRRTVQTRNKVQPGNASNRLNLMSNRMVRESRLVPIPPSNQQKMPLGNNGNGSTNRLTGSTSSSPSNSCQNSNNNNINNKATMTPSSSLRNVPAAVTKVTKSAKKESSNREESAIRRLPMSSSARMRTRSLQQFTAKSCDRKNKHDASTVAAADQMGSSGTVASPVMTTASLSVLFPKEVINKYEIGQIIGDGNFAVVHECMNRSNRSAFALKIIDKTKCKGREFMITNEVSILRRIHHPNVIRLVEDFDYYNELYLVTELVTGGDLFDSIAEANKYSEKEASRMMNDLSNALSYLHSIKICHRDIKPENLLVCDYSWMDTRIQRDSPADSNYSFKILKLADFGLAIELDPGSKLFDVCGTPNYVAPEILSESGYDHKVDVWAAGVIAFVLLCGFPPFVSPDNDQDELFDQILTGKFEFSSPAFDSITEQAKQLISSMLQVDPEERASASQVYQHPWISGLPPSSSSSHASKLEERLMIDCLNDNAALGEEEARMRPVSSTSSSCNSSAASSAAASPTSIASSASSSDHDSGTGTGTGSPSAKQEPHVHNMTAG